MKDTTIQQLQNEVDKWIKAYGVRYFSPLTNMAILTEEVGEVARIMSRLYGDQSAKKGEEPTREHLADELADLLWVATCIANQCGINLQEAIEKNFDKKTQRDKHRHLNNSKLKENILISDKQEKDEFTNQK